MDLYGVNVNYIVWCSDLNKETNSLLQGASRLMRLLASTSNLYIWSCEETSRMSFSSEKVLSAVLADILDENRLGGGCAYAVLLKPFKYILRDST